MAQGDASFATTHPDAFREGMLVRHPEYGLGKIVALSGIGPRRTATVNLRRLPGKRNSCYNRARYGR
jgi:hypothetical protein